MSQFTNNQTTTIGQDAQRQRSTILILKKPWYFRFNKSEDDADIESSTAPPTVPSSDRSVGNHKRARGLMDDHTLEQMEGKLIVSMITQSGYRLYTLFDNYIEFAGFHQRYPPADRNFYELAIGDFLQKPHFDLDVKAGDIGNTTLSLDEVGEQLKDTVVEQIIAILAEKDVRLDIRRDVLIFTSHGNTSVSSKRSYHIVINNYCHYNHKEARALYDLVISRFPDSMKPFAKFVDVAVYSSKQQFRMLGSQKKDSGRPKRFASSWMYKGQQIDHIYLEQPEDSDHEFMLQLEESLLTNTASCYLLPSL